MADSRSAPEVKLDLPITPGPFAPTWESIEKNYPGTPAWLREAKFGIWVHFGPQAAGKSGDWYARKLYMPGTPAYKNHLPITAIPSEVGYKEVLRDWNPTKLDPAKLVAIYKDAGARFLIIQGVHHDQFDMWNSKYQPWNSTRLGPKRDLLGEWTKAARAADIRFGVTFHHEYSWWWWQTAFGADRRRPQTRRPLRRPPHPRRRQGQVVGRPRPTPPLRRRSPRIQRRRQSRQHRLEPPARRHLSKPRRLRQMVCHLVGPAHDGRRR